jgi:hypothetical protein
MFTGAFPLSAGKVDVAPEPLTTVNVVLFVGIALNPPTV